MSSCIEDKLQNLTQLSVSMAIQGILISDTNVLKVKRFSSTINQIPHRCPGNDRSCYNVHDIRYNGDYTYISEEVVNSSWTKMKCTEAMVCDHVDDKLTVSNCTTWGGHLFRRFCLLFLRVLQAVGLFCSCHAAQASKGNVQKTQYKTFRTSGRPTQYNKVCDAS